MRQRNREREKVTARSFTRHCVSDALIFDLQKSENVVFLCLNAIKHDFWDNPYISNLSKGLVNVGESNGEREKVRGRWFTKHCVSNVLIFNLKNSKNVDFLCTNVLKHVFWDKPHVGNLSYGLKSVIESNGERKNIKARRFTRYWVSDALKFNLQNSKNIVFLCINAIKHDFWHNPYVGNLSKGLVSVG